MQKRVSNNLRAFTNLSSGKSSKVNLSIKRHFNINAAVTTVCFYAAIEH